MWPGATGLLRRIGIIRSQVTQLSKSGSRGRAAPCYFGNIGAHVPHARMEEIR